MSTVSAIANEFNDARQLIADLAKETGLINEGFSSYGYTKALSKEDRWLEIDTPNTIVDKISEPVIFSDGLHERLGEESLSNGNFANGEDYWIFTAEWRVVDGKAYFDGDGNSQIVQTIAYGPGDCIRIKINSEATQARGSLSCYIREDGNLVAVDEGIVDGEAELFYYCNGNVTELDVRAGFDGARWNGYVNNISVKELQTATLPEAPFDPSATDELLDDKVNGLVCQQSHSKGDIVVTGNELGSDFSTTPTNFTIGDSFEIVGGQLVNTGAAFGSYVYINNLSSVEYHIQAVGNGLNIEIYDGNSWNNIAAGVDINDTFYLENLRIAGVTNATLDIISVTLKDSIKQATVDTSEMYDYVFKNNDGLASNVSQDEVIFIESNNNPSLVGHFYKLKSTQSGNLLDSYSAFDNTNYWLDLETTSNMDLRNPYFQTLDYVSRQDLIYVSKNIATSTVQYKSVKGLKHYLDADILNSDLIASDRGWTKLGNNLYSDGVDEITCITVIPRLNSGVYHPVYNYFGCTNTINTDENSTKPWYGYTAKIMNSTYNAFSAKYAPLTDGNIGGSSGRPDDKFYDKVYPEGENGLIYKQSSAKEIHESALVQEWQRDCVSDLDGVESGVETYKSVMSSGGGNAYNLIGSDLYVFTANNIGAYDYTKVQLGDIFYMTDGSGNIMEAVYDGGLLVATDIELKLVINHGMSPGFTVQDGNQAFIWSQKTPYKTTQGKSLSIDALSDPSNWDSSWVARLASGKALPFNALLVGQDGTSYVNNGNQFCIFSSKALNSNLLLYSADSGVSYSSVSFTLDNIENYRSDSALATGASYIASYTSQNQTLQQQDPIEILAVGSQAIASNSHSIYKGAMLGNSATDKVLVGNGSNPLESRTLENNISQGYTVIVDDTNKDTLLGDYPIGTVFYISGINGGYTHATLSPDTGKVYEYYASGSNTSTTLQAASFKYATSFRDLGYLFTPSHNTINLDNSDSSAFKGLPFVGKASNGELVVGMFTEEGKYNASGYGWDTGVGLTFQHLANGLVDGVYENDLQTKILYKRTGRFPE